MYVLKKYVYVFTTEGFVCATCHCVLNGKYARKDGLVYCEEDYEKIVQELIPESDAIS